LVFASARDVTAEKLAAEELQRAHHDLEQRIRERTADLEIANRDLYERKELFRRLFEDSPIGTALIAVDQRLTKVNGALCGLLGYGASELLGLTLEDITYHDDMQKGVDLMSKTIGGLIPGYRLTKRYLRKDREIVWVDVNVTILRDQLGTPITVLAKVENVNDRLRHDEEITRLNQELQSRVDELTVVNQELESFNYSVSHDLRAPLRHMDGFSTILLEECRMQIPASSRKYLELISEGARRMGRMVDELLELSRTSRKELVKQPTGLKSLVDDVLKELRSELNQRAVEFRIGNLPFVDCDPGLARQVFANLLSNALKFTGPRKRALIEVGQTWREGQLVVFVRDNGVGFNMKYAGKLFGVFHRLHRREDFEGTGAGLATVQRIIQKHGGRIWAEAELEKGATFFFTLGPPQEEETESEEQNTEVLAGAT
jgi:PAS domain S-box-containing protein